MQKEKAMKRVKHVTAFTAAALYGFGAFVSMDFGWVFGTSANAMAGRAVAGILFLAVSLTVALVHYDDLVSGDDQ